MEPELFKIEDSWKLVLSDIFKQPEFDILAFRLKQSISEGKEIYPPGHLIFNAFNSTPFPAVKVVILGQDPYHNPGEAMGLSFSVPKGVKIPPSLKNIFKELSTDLHCHVPNHGDLSYWAKQGVFLLNAILTVQKNNAASHKDLGWQWFTEKVIQSISDQKQHIVFLLWGNFAKSKKKFIDTSKHLVLEAAHPSPLAGNAFQNCHHFSKSNAYLLQHQLTPIDWQII